MEFRTLEIRVMSANNLKNVNFFSRMNVYAAVSISGGGDEKCKQIAKTPVDRDGHTNPSWNFPVNFTFDETAARQGRLMIVFKLRCRRDLGDKDVGEVHVPVKELLDSPAAGGSSKQFVIYQVRKPSGRPKGQLTFCYQFGEKTSGAAYPAAAAAAHKAHDEPVTAYPAFTPSVGSSSVYSAGPTPKPASVAYPAPGGYPPAGYGGYPPPGYLPPPQYGYAPQPGYGYPPVQQPAKKNKFGLGFGTGLLGGALGGMLIGDAISDAGGYDDGGFCDGGFDF